jgi:hypothetical protein
MFASDRTDARDVTRAWVGRYYARRSIEVMTMTSVNEGLWTEGITSTRTRERDRRDVHGTKDT